MCTVVVLFSPCTPCLASRSPSAWQAYLYSGLVACPEGEITGLALTPPRQLYTTLACIYADLLHVSPSTRSTLLRRQHRRRTWSSSARARESTFFSTTSPTDEQVSLCLSLLSARCARGIHSLEVRRRESHVSPPPPQKKIKCDEQKNGGYASAETPTKRRDRYPISLQGSFWYTNLGVACVLLLAQYIRWAGYFPHMRVRSERPQRLEL